jgi:7-cyano-7-deazaguanine synthase in queuosine biosynthesis
VRAVVLLSGGLDSATTLAIARSEGFSCYTLSVNYGQRHKAELDAAGRVARALGAREHRVMTVDLAGIGGSALTDPAVPVPEQATQGIPITYVPARNTIMLALALAWAEVLDARAIFIGVNARDYSVSGDTRVWIRDHSGARLLRIEDVYELPAEDLETIAVEPQSLQLSWRRVLGRYRHDASAKRCYRVKLERGQELTVTEDHSLFTTDGTGRLVPVKGSALALGMPLVVPFDLTEQMSAWQRELDVIDLRVPNAGFTQDALWSSVAEASGFLRNRLRQTRIPLDLPITDDFLRIVGLWLAEGGKAKDSRVSTLSFSVGGLPGAAELLRSYFSCFGISVHKSPQNDIDYRVHSSVACEAFRRLHLMGTSKRGEKRFPPWIWSLSQRQRRVLVAGLWDGDGCMFWKGEAPIHQKSHEIIDVLYHILLLDGIFPSLKLAAHGQKRLALTRTSDFARFLDLYPLQHVGKRDSLLKAASITGRDKTTGLWKSKGLWEVVAAASLMPGRKTRVYNAGGKYDVSLRAQRVAFAEVPALRNLVASRLAFLRVVAIEPVAHQFMYDLSVERAENFFANGILAHNSGYPDCRPEFVHAFESLAARATKAGVEGKQCRIHAPLIELTKSDIVRRGLELGVDFSLTVSCYQADEEGRACGRCDACRIRRAGFEAAGVADPTRYQ